MIGDIIAKWILAAFTGILPLAQTQNMDSVLTMDANGSISAQPTERIYTERNDRAAAEEPKKIDNASLGIKVSGKAAIVVDEKSGKVLWQKDPDGAYPIASLTKLLTSLVVMDQNPDWSDEYALKEDENNLNGAKFHEPTGTKITIDQLMTISLVGSANNATLAMARSTGLSDEDFVRRMNEKVKAWGLANTFFEEPTGLSEKNVSTAREYARIALEAFSHDKVIQAASHKEYELTIASNNSHHVVKSTNKIYDTFLRVIASKTGFTYEAGYCLATLVTNDKNHNVLIVIFGSDSDENRLNDTKALATWAYKNFEWK